LSSKEVGIQAPHGKVKLTIEYDGTDYHGWQRQGPGFKSIQGTIEEALKDLFGKQIHLLGAGRTDAGVHAINQVAHFIPPREISTFNFISLFQSRLPRDITIKKAEPVPATFHAQKDALSKTYIYRIWNQPVASALRARYSLWIRQPLNLERLNQACEYILGKHDFNALRSEGSAVNTTTRTVFWAKFLKSDEFIEFQINGSGFLKQMVRNIVGTFLQIEFGQRDLESIPSLLASRDRKGAGPTVEPQGLYLSEVFYPPHLDNSRRSL
jgi:tRNA pseudouridine38-40 synthase